MRIHVLPLHLRTMKLPLVRLPSPLGKRCSASYLTCMSPSPLGRKRQGYTFFKKGQLLRIGNEKLALAHFPSDG